jgi:hypothetical protein
MQQDAQIQNYSFTLSTDFVCRLFLIWLKLKNDEIGWAFSTHQETGRCIWNFNCKIEGKLWLFGLDIDGRIILKWVVRLWTGSIGSRYGLVTDSYKHGSEPSSSTKRGKYLGKLSDFQLPVICVSFTFLWGLHFMNYRM